MGWQVRYAPRAVATLRALDQTAARHILDTLAQLATHTDPHAACAALAGPLDGLWGLTVDAHRAILDIRRHEVVVVVIDRTEHTR